MAVTDAQALAILPLATMKAELRVQPEILDHDALITGQITAAVSFVAKATGREVADLGELRAAVVAAVRLPEVTPNAAHNALMDPFRSIAG